MGRHSSPDQVPFYRSVVSWSLPWLMIAAVVGVAVWIGVDAVSNDDVRVPPSIAQRSPSPEDSPTLDAESPEPSPEPQRTTEPTPKEPAEEFDARGASVQVLNGTTSAQADDRMANRLVRLGFRVVAIESASREYPRTTVFWSTSSARAVAEALAERFDWVAEEKPANLSSTVDVHVVVGADEA